MSREKDRFNIVYVGDCEKTEDKSYFVQHTHFKCWTDQSGSDQSLYLAILPLFDSSKERRKNILDRIVARYKPACNSDDIKEEKPEYVVRKTAEPEISEKVTCACCGSEMKPEQILDKSTVYRCGSCGISDTRINS